MKPFTKKIVLENGREFYGYGFGADREAINEIVFNTSMVGYQEIMSDPSYTDQMVVMTYPLIGNYGMADEDYETKNPTIGGMIVREYNDSPSNFRYTKTLNEVFEEYGIPAIWGVDTRTLTRIIRNEGSQKVIVTDAATPREEAMRKLAGYCLPHDMVSRVSCKTLDVARSQPQVRRGGRRLRHQAQYHPPAQPRGLQRDHRALRLDGRGDHGLPSRRHRAVERPRQPRGCDAGDRAGQATARQTADFRHLHGAPAHIAGLWRQDREDEIRPPRREPPRENLETGRIEITSQNHSYAVDIDSLAATGLRLTHVNLLDGTAEGVECAEDGVFSMQYHPESASGPQDSSYLFKKFTKIMEERKNA